MKAEMNIGLRSIGMEARFPNPIQKPTNFHWGDWLQTPRVRGEQVSVCISALVLFALVVLAAGWPDRIFIYIPPCRGETGVYPWIYWCISILWSSAAFFGYLDGKHFRIDRVKCDGNGVHLTHSQIKRPMSDYETEESFIPWSRVLKVADVVEDNGEGGSIYGIHFDLKTQLPNGECVLKLEVPTIDQSIKAVKKITALRANFV